MELPKSQRALVETIYQCARSSIIFETKLIAGGKPLAIFPHLVVYLGGELLLLGEDTRDGRLISLTILDEIKEVRLLQKVPYKSNFSAKEVEDFITASRAMAGNEERLVLKIDPGGGVNLNPHFHFMGNPCIISSADGNYIWAASVELGTELLHWLAGMGNKIEVLEPQAIQEELEKFNLLCSK